MLVVWFALLIWHLRAVYRARNVDLYQLAQDVADAQDGLSDAYEQLRRAEEKRRAEIAAASVAYGHALDEIREIEDMVAVESEWDISDDPLWQEWNIEPAPDD